MNSDLFKVKIQDIVKALLLAVGGAIIATLAGLASTPNFDVFQADWTTIGKMIVNVSFIAFATQLSSTFFSDKEGKLGGKI